MSRPRQKRASVPAWVAAAALFAGLVVLGTAVRQGDLEVVDHFAYMHLQPLRKGSWNLLTTPAGPVAASLLVLAATVRIRPRPGVRGAWLLVLAASVALEVVGKRLVVHAHVDPERLPWIAHDGYPSGHTMRGILVAGALASAWPRARLPIIVWAVANAALVETTGMHPLSEVVGGLLGGMALIACARVARRTPVVAEPDERGAGAAARRPTPAR
jgi:membrane-associated phospholipid phosphatase